MLFLYLRGFHTMHKLFVIWLFIEKRKILLSLGKNNWPTSSESGRSDGCESRRKWDGGKFFLLLSL